MSDMANAIMDAAERRAEDGQMRLWARWVRPLATCPRKSSGSRLLQARYRPADVVWNAR